MSHAIDDTKEILADFRSLNKESWTVRYPSLTPAAESSRPRLSARHSLSFADDPTKHIEVDVPRNGMRRSVTLATVVDEASDESFSSDGSLTEEPGNESQEGLVPPAFQILRLDLKLGPHGASSQVGGLISQLEKQSIASLIEERINHSLQHLDKLALRVKDTSSKVLVTGDLNAGKSTFVNALLGRSVMPVDQQPCTTMFCEVHDVSENDGVEEAHVVNDGCTYDLNDETTFTRAGLEDLEGIISESDAQHQSHIYVKDVHDSNQSLLHNGIADITLIDAPGLNRDSLGTTEVYARQEEIDVVAFVVSAENHFTLSAKEFLFTASNEKAFIFVVVNKFDQIRDKARCRRMILDQIKNLSPQTWENAEDLVHFVDSQSALARATTPNAELHARSALPPATFDRAVSELRSFVLLKRARSKFGPVITYLSNIISDLELLIGTNRILATAEIEQAKDRLNNLRPVVERMTRDRQVLDDGLGTEEDETTQEVYDQALRILDQALERVGNGEVAVDTDMLQHSRSKESVAIPRLPAYPGLLSVWDYAAEVRKALLVSLELAVSLAEDRARSTTAAGVERVFTLAERYLPKDAPIRHRVFIPEAMFCPRKKGRKQIVVAGGTHNLGIGLAQRHDLREVSFVDLITFHHKLFKELEEEDAHYVWRLISVSLGAVTMLGGKAIGLHGFVEGMGRVASILGNERDRRWLLAAMAIAAASATAYAVWELPRTVPRSIGWQLKQSLNPSTAEHLSSALVSTPAPLGFAASNALRIRKEASKVMRLASWDSKDRFRAVHEDKSAAVRADEDTLKRSTKAIERFDEMESRMESVRMQIDIAID